MHGKALLDFRFRGNERVKLRLILRSDAKHRVSKSLPPDLIRGMGFGPAWFETHRCAMLLTMRGRPSHALLIRSPAVVMRRGNACRAFSPPQIADCFTPACQARG